MAEHEDLKDKANIFVESGVTKEGKPFCVVSVNGEVIGQISPDEVRMMALGWLQAAEAAEGDAAVFLGMKEIGIDLMTIGAFISDLREMRQKTKELARGE